MSNTSLSILIPLAAAWAAGCVIGLEREFHGRPAGFRTHALVCLASALLTLVMTQPHDWLYLLPQGSVRSDPVRVVEAIMTGIGFLGAGVIFRSGLNVHGLTTAASIWATAALGILYGIGLWLPAIAGTAAVIVTLAVFQRLEDWVPEKHRVDQVLKFRKDQVPARTELWGVLGDHGFSVSVGAYAVVEKGSACEYRLATTTRKVANIEELALALEVFPGILEYSLTPHSE